MAHSNMRLRPVHCRSESGLMFQIDRAVAQVNDKVVALSGVDIEVSSALADFQLCVLPTGIVQRKPRELDAGVRREADGAAIFEFDLYASIILVEMRVPCRTGKFSSADSKPSPVRRSIWTFPSTLLKRTILAWESANEGAASTMTENPANRLVNQRPIPTWVIVAAFGSRGPF